MGNWIKCEGTDHKPIYLNFDVAISVTEITPAGRPAMTRVTFMGHTNNGDPHVEILDSLDAIAARLQNLPK